MLERSMNKYTVKELYKTLGQALKKLPFEITYHGKVKAIVLSPDKFEGETDIEIEVEL